MFAIRKEADSIIQEDLIDATNKVLKIYKEKQVESKLYS